MTDILTIARECGAADCFGNDIPGHENAYILTESQLTAYTERIRAEERERCAKVCDRICETFTTSAKHRGMPLEARSLARHQAEIAQECASAIRTPSSSEATEGRTQG